jgi:threonine dehydrogenase-like Zn-dependent dehydrogenase
MMDLYCPICHEPWDNDAFHEVAGEAKEDGDSERDSYAKVAALFRTKGCGKAFYGTAYHNSHCKRVENEDGRLSALYELLGDDMDGAASMIEDLLHY